MSERRLGNVKRVSLASVAEGWDDCYAVVKKATMDEWQAFSEQDVEKMTNIEASRLAADFAKDHFVSGKVMVLGDSGDLTSSDMTANDVLEDSDIAQLLFQAVTGVAPDPKGSSTSTETSSTNEQPSDTNV